MDVVHKTTFEVEANGGALEEDGTEALCCNASGSKVKPSYDLLQSLSLHIRYLPVELITITTCR